ncbi:MAG: HAMP domain-containing histidine kinase [Chloroflexi bacterium]|nr:HAMP domain-containing histidine kinase [Chloroflexota bacterium]MBI3168906.1 HAMP domain-containing histidine kinase [Chloroflexota bacterium]
MNIHSIRWRLPASYAVIVLLATLSLGSVMMLVLRSYYVRQEQEYLLGNALALQPVLEKMLQYEKREEVLKDQITPLSFLSRTQIRLLDLHGNIIVDSGIPAPNQVVAISGSSDATNTKFFTQTIDGPIGPASLFIYSSGESASLPVQAIEGIVSPPGEPGNMLVAVSASPYGYGFVTKVDGDPSRRSSQVVTVRLNSPDGPPLGMLEFSNGPSYGADVIGSVTLAWLIASIFAIAIAALAGWYASRQVTRPVLALEHATHEMARGDLSVRVDLQNEKQHEFLSLAHSFNGMAEQVEQTVSTLRSFISDAAHEFHTPLTALQTNIELARDAMLAPHANADENASAQTRYLLRAQEQSQRLEALVKSLLDLSRVESAEDKSSFVPLNLSDLLREVAEQYASRAEQSNRTLELDLPDEPIEIMGNAMQLHQVFVNLLENALKFTRDNDTIRLSATSKEKDLIIEVLDTGIGIPADDLSNMFKRFHRGRNVSDIAGNGLGLAIVKAVVERHGGTVLARSMGIGMGSTFIVTLPVHL